MENALDQALKSVGGAFTGATNFFGNVGHDISQMPQNFSNTLQQLPNEALQVGAALQPHAENILQGASLGYYQAPQQDQQNVSPFVSELEKGIGAAVPFGVAAVATGGLADAAFVPEIAAGADLSPEAYFAARNGITAAQIAGTTSAGALVGGLQNPGQNGNRLVNAAVGGVQGLGLGAIDSFTGSIANPLIKAGVQSLIGSGGNAALTALQGGNKSQILASAVLGAGTPLFLKGVEHFGGGEAGHNLMNTLFDKFGSDSYRFIANKDLIQRVVTGQGSAEDLYQFNILNDLGAAAEAGRKGVSVEDTTTRVPKSGPVWDFLKTVFPSSFQGDVPSSDFTNPQTTPLAAIPEMALSPEENDALQKIDERDKNPLDTQQPVQAAEEQNTPEGEKGLSLQDKREHGKDLITPEGKQQLATVYQKALENRPILDSLLDSTGQQTGANVVSNLKDPDTLLNKTVEKRVADEDRHYGLSDVNDVTRGRLVYNNEQQVQQGVANLKQQVDGYNQQHPDATIKIAKEDNFFAHPQDLYQGYHIDLAFPNGQHSEVQFHTQKSYAASLATHPIHELYGSQPLPPDALAQKEGIINQINSLSDEQAAQLSQSIEQRNAPKQAEGAQKARQVVEGNHQLTAEHTVLEALHAGDTPAATALHQAYQAEFPNFPTFDELQTQAKQHQEQSLAEGSLETAKNSVMKHPEVAQYAATIRKAARIYNLVKAKGKDDISTITLKVPGLDSALQSLREKGVDVQNMDHLVQLAKELPKKSDKVSLKPAPQTAAEHLVNKVTSPQETPPDQEPISMNGTKFTPDALPYIQQLFDSTKRSGVYDQPGYFANSVLPDISWNHFLDTHPDFNNHEGGPKKLADAKGFFAWMDPKAIAPDQNNLDIVIDKRIADQFRHNQPLIVRKNDDGTYTKVDGQHRVLASQALDNPRVPVLVLDDTSSTVAHAYDQVKQGQQIPFIQAKPLAVRNVAPEEPKLPLNLRGATPRYKDATLAFQSDVDKALYIIANKNTKSANHDAYLNFAREVLPGKSDEELRQLGIRVKNTIKNIASDDNGRITIPQTTTRISMKTAPTPVTPSPAPYDFEKEMDAYSRQNTDTFLGNNTPEENAKQSQNTVGAAEGAGAFTPPGQTPSFSRQPANGYVEQVHPILSRIAQGGESTYPVGRDFTKIMVGRKTTNQHLAQIGKDWIDKTLPNEQDRQAAALALDGAIPMDKLTPEQKAVVEQMGGIDEMIGLRRQEMYPGFQMIEQHITRIPTSSPTEQEKQMTGGKPLSQTAREMFHRNIWRFVPTDGSGKGKIMSTAADNFNLTRSTEDKNVWVDPKGQTYTMEHATIPEIEKAFKGLTYEKDLGRIMGQTVETFLNQKDHHFAVEAVKNGMWNGEAAAPGEPAQDKWRGVDVKGLEGWKFSPKVATSLENLSHDPNIAQWEQAYGKAEDFVTSLVFYNALKHPLNMANLAFISSGDYRTGNPLIDAVLPGPLGIGKLASLLPTANTVGHEKGDVYYALKDAGSTIGTFGKTQSEGFMKKAQQSGLKTGMEVAGKLNPLGWVYQGNKAIVGHMDDVLRIGSTLLQYETIHGSPLTTDGKTLAPDFDPEHLKQATSKADEAMVDYGNMSRGEKKAQRMAFMFYPWMKGLFQNAYQMARHPWDSRGRIQNLLLFGMAAWAANYLWQKATGNADASVDQYGLNKFISDATQLPGQLVQDYRNPTQARIPSLISSHLGRPILKEVAQQAFNKDLFSGKPIYDPNKLVLESQAGQAQQSQPAARLEHLTQGLAAPAAPLLKTKVVSDYLQSKGIPVKSGSQTPTESVLSNLLGFKTPHTTGHAAAPAISSGPLAGLNQPGSQSTTGIAAVNFIDELNKQTDPNTKAKLQNVSQLMSQAFAENNPAAKIQAYQLLAQDPTALKVKSMMEVGTAQAEKKPVNPLWEMGLTNPDAQQIVMQYKAMIPGPDQKNFKADPQHAAVLSAYGQMESQYYNSLATSDTSNFQAQSGINVPQPSKEVQTLLSQYRQTKNYSILDDPRVKAYYSQLDFYDAYVRGEFGLSGTGYTSGSSGKGYSSPYSQAGTAAYMDRTLERQYMMENLRQTANTPPVKLTPLKIQPQQALTQTLANGKKGLLKVTVGQGPKLQSNGLPVGLPQSQRLQIKSPAYSPVRMQKSGIQNIM